MKVSIIMGSTSDLEVMSGAFGILEDFGIEYEKRVISAHRTPELMFEYTKALKDRGFGVVIAGAGGAAHILVMQYAGQQRREPARMEHRAHQRDVRQVRAAGYEFHAWTIDQLDLTLKAFANGAQTVTPNCAKKN